MYLPRELFAHLYRQSVRNLQASSSPVLILTSLDPDSLCACRILTSLLRRDYVQHKVQPVGGYGELCDVGIEFIQPMKTTNGGSGGFVICLGVGGLVDLEDKLGLETTDGDSSDFGGVTVWVFDSKRPYNLTNVFGGYESDLSKPSAVRDSSRSGIIQGQVTQSYKPGSGGIIVFDNGDVFHGMNEERRAYCTLADMPELGGSENGDERHTLSIDGDDDPDDEVACRASDSDSQMLSASATRFSKKRKSSLISTSTDSHTDSEHHPSKRRMPEVWNTDVSYASDIGLASDPNISFHAECL